MQRPKGWYWSRVIQIEFARIFLRSNSSLQHEHRFRHFQSLGILHKAPRRSCGLWRIVRGFMTTFRLRFPVGEIEYWAERYEDDDKVVLGFVPAARRRGYLTEQEFL